MHRGHEIEKSFPDYFKNFELPADVKEEKLQAYRACKTQKCDKESFASTYEEKKGNFSDEELKNPSTYSLSLFWKAKDIRRFTVIDSEYEKPYKIAIGHTEPCCGVVKKSSSKKSSHIDWWLYVNAKPYLHFKIIGDFDKHYMSLKKGKKNEK